MPALDFGTKDNGNGLHTAIATAQQPTSDSVTVALWVYLTSYSGNHFGVLMSSALASGSLRWKLAAANGFGASKGAEWEFYRSGGSSYSGTSANALSTGKWWFIVGRETGQNLAPSVWTGDLSNIISDKSTSAGGHNSAANQDGTGSINIGRQSIISSSSAPASYAYAALWDRALTDEEVKQLQYNPINVGLRMPNLRGMWLPGSGGLTTNVKDLSPYGNDMYIHENSAGSLNLFQGSGTWVEKLKEPKRLWDLPNFVPAAAASGVALLSHPHRHTNLGFG